MSEEEIKLVENLIKEYKLYGDLDGIAINDMSAYINALEHLIKACKEIEHKYNKALSDLVQAEHKNKELEEKNSLLIQQNITYKRNIHDLKNKNIQVSLVEEKIEEIDKIYKGIPEDEGNFAKAILIKEKQVLQELLEKRK